MRQKLLLTTRGCREGSLSLVQRPERPAMPNQDKLGPWLVMWEYQVVPPLCLLIPTMHVGSFMCLCVCMFSALIKFQLQNALHPFVECSSTLACVTLSLHSALLFVWIKPIVHLLFRHLSMTVFTCWSPSLSPAPLLHGPDAGDGARLCQEPWFSQTAGWEPDIKQK